MTLEYSRGYLATDSEHRHIINRSYSLSWTAKKTLWNKSADSSRRIKWWRREFFSKTFPLPFVRTHSVSAKLGMSGAAVQTWWLTSNYQYQVYQLSKSLMTCGLENKCAGALSKSSHSTVAKHFAAPKTKEEIKKAWIESIPKKTQEDTAHCVRLLLSWSKYRAATTGIPVPPLAVLSATTEHL